MSELILAIVLGIHLWCVNISSSAPLFAALALWTGLERTEGTEESPHGEGVGVCPARWFVWRGIVMLFLGGLLGLLIAAIMWGFNDRELFAVLDRFTYKITWGLIELVFYWVCAGIHLWLIGRHPGRARWGKTILALLASTNLLYHFPTLFSVMTMLAREPTLIEGPVGPSEFRQLMMRGHVAALSVHFGFASIAVGASLALSFLARQADSLKPAEARFARWSATLGLATTGLQIPVGIWLLTRLEPAAQSRIMGGHLLATAAFAASIFLGFRLLNQFGAIVISPSETGRLARPIQHLLWLIIGLMCFTLQAAS